LSTELVNMDSENVVSIVLEIVLDWEANVSPGVTFHLDGSVGLIRALVFPGNSGIGNLFVCEIAFQLNKMNFTW
jgi:hypothetical protein